MCMSAIFLIKMSLYFVSGLTNHFNHVKHVKFLCLFLFASLNWDVLFFIDSLFLTRKKEDIKVTMEKIWIFIRIVPNFWKKFQQSHKFFFLNKKTQKIG